MNKNVVAILIGAICTAFLVAFMVQAALRPSPTAEVQVSQPMTRILIAAERLSVGETINASKVRWQDWPEQASLPGAILAQDNDSISDLDIMGKVVTRSIQMGEPVVRGAVLMEAGGNFMAATISPGMLGYSIPVSPASSVGGFARPGDHVDVILTYRVRLDREQNANTLVRDFASETILQNVRVLAVDQTAVEEERQARIGRVVTLEVSPKGAEVMALALEMGDISLALKRLGDASGEGRIDAPQPTTDLGISRTLQGLRQMDGGRGGYANGNGANVRVYRGGEREDITVPRSR